MKSKIIMSVWLATMLATGFAQGQSTQQQPVEATNSRAFQISFVPMFGTSRGPAEGYTNHFSLNIFAGYEHSLQGAEIGSFYNIDKYNVTGAQIAGFGNTVGGSVTGLQLSGFVNTAKSHVTGAQLSGFANVTTGNAKGAQVAGFANLADSTTGLQFAGLGNLSTKDVNGAQISGFVNVSPKNVMGAQVAGFVNTAKALKGAQVAGFVNKASTVSGTQIGFINIADSVEQGVVIGFLNFIKTGKHQFAVEHNEVMDMNVSFRSGTDRLYSTVFVGIQAKNDFLWSYGGGFGTQLNFKNNLSSTIELTAQTIVPKEGHYDKLNLLNRLSLNVEYQLANHLSIAAGPALNVYVTRVYNNETGTYGDPIDKGAFYNETFSGTNIKMWVGYNLAIKF